MVDNPRRKQRHPPRDGDARVAAVAARQHGLITAEQLRTAGIGGRAAHHRLKAGRLHSIHRGVYSVGHAGLTREARWLAAVLAVGGDAVLSHMSAAILWGLLRDFGRNPRVDVTTTRAGIRSRAGIRVHWTRTLARGEITRECGIPVTRPPRVIADIAPHVSDAALNRAVRQALVDRVADLPAIARQLRAGRPGTTRLRRLLALDPQPTRSPLEDRVLDLIERAGLPRPLVNQTVTVGGREYEVDFLYPEHGLVIEADGAAYHANEVSRRHDAAKQAALEAAALRVLRVDSPQVDDRPQQTARRITALLRSAPGHHAGRST